MVRFHEDMINALTWLTSAESKVAELDSAADSTSGEEGYKVETLKTELTVRNLDLCHHFGEKMSTNSCAKRVETLCLLKRIFRSRTSLFSFTPPPHFNVVAATKSIRQSNILNIEKGEGGNGRMQCNFIENEGKSTDYS